MFSGYVPGVRGRSDAEVSGGKYATLLPENSSDRSVVEIRMVGHLDIMPEAPLGTAGHEGTVNSQTLSRSVLSDSSSGRAKVFSCCFEWINRWLATMMGGQPTGEPCDEE